MKRSMISLVAAAVLVPSMAFADVITPDEEACRGKAPGEACILPAGGAGECVAGTVPVGNPAADATRTRVTCRPPSSDAGVADGGSSTPRSGCSVSPGRSSRGASLGLLLSAGLGVALMRRRRRETHGDVA